MHSPVANSSVHFSPVLNSSLISSQVQTPVINVSGQSSPPSTPVETMSDESCNDTTDNNNLQECTEDKTVVSGKWLTSQQLYQELNNSNDIFSTVSIGRKNNKFFVVDNSSNSTRQQNQQRSNSFDDCGVWASGQAQSSKTIFLKICNK